MRLNYWEMTQSEFVNPPQTSAKLTEALAGLRYRKFGDYSDFPPDIAARIQAIEEYDKAFREMRAEALQALRKEMLREFRGTACYPKVRTVVRWGSAQMNADAHRAIVKRAMRQGKPVPERVLADYPELLAMARRGERPTRRTAYPWESDRQQWEQFAANAPGWIAAKDVSIADLEKAMARCRTPNGRAREYRSQIEHLRREIERISSDLVVCQDYLRACHEEDTVDGLGHLHQAA